MSTMSSGEENERTMLAEAVAQVDRLDELLASIEDDQPNSEAQSGGSILYQVNFDTNFEDRNGFVTGIAKYMEEATIHATLNKLLEEGEQHAVMLYTWRCCTRGIPPIQSNDDPNREQIHTMAVEVLLPHVEKLNDLIKFQKIAIDRFCSEVKILCHSEKRKEFVSSAYLLTLGKLINMFAILDELKNIKSSVKIDFSTFRRAALYLKMMSDALALQESQNLSVFLATPNKIRDNLKENLEKIQNYEDVIADVINICVHRFEQKLYVALEEKHMLVKVIGFCLGLVDTCRSNMYKLDNKKKIRIDKIDRIFKSVEVVPLYGDMQISPFNYIKNSRNYDASRWPNCSAGSPDFSPIDLVKLLPQISQDNLTYLSKVQAHSASSESENEKILNLALKGLQLLSEWTAVVLELHSFKLLHPTDHHQNKECPQNAEEYERATKYNYTDSEKSALVQIIGMIKGLQNVMAKMEPVFSEGIRRDIYLKLQTFVQVTLREPLRKAVKHKRNVLRSVLISIRDTCAEWMGGGSLQNQDPAMKGEKGPIEVRILKRCVGPSSTQLYLLQTMLESLLSDKTCAKRTLRKDLDSIHLPGIEDFHRRTFFWGYLLNFAEILEKCCDLGQMWYREFYLELTMGRRIQFPIAMSMPWILIEHVLDNPSLIEFALFPLAMYNDSANCALNVFRKQWLFDEILAEVNLAFDQFVFKLSEQIYAYFKHCAAVGSLNSKFRQDWATNSKAPLSSPPPPLVKTVIRYEGLMQQRRVHLLSHYIDLNKLIRQRISTDILKSMKASISKFEEGDLTGVVQLEAMMRLNRETHKLLKRWIPSLDDFEIFWREANCSVSAPHGRIALHIICELTRDFIPDYCYNGSTKRFVKSQGVTYSRRNEERLTAPPVAPKYLWGSKQLNATYDAVFKVYSGFIGEPHFRVIVNLLGYQGLTLALKELNKICERLINGEISLWVKVLKDSVLPKYIKPPKKPLNDKGTRGLLAYYLQVLSSVIQHPGVKMELFQHFRQVGNAVLFCLLAEQSLATEESFKTTHVAPFKGVPQEQEQQEEEGFSGASKKDKAMEENMNKLFKALHVCGNISQFGTEIQRNLAKEDELLSSEHLTFGRRIFPQIIKKISEMLLGKTNESMESVHDDDDTGGGGEKVWTGPPPVNHVMNMHRCGEFHRVWSALQFLCCIPVGPNEFTVEQLFGDGLNWTGCIFIVLLDQQRRFQTFDFCNHLWESYREDHRSDDGDDVCGIKIEQIMGKIRAIQSLNTGIFSIISNCISDFGEPTINSMGKVRCYLPPIHKSLVLDDDGDTGYVPETLLEQPDGLVASPDSDDMISTISEDDDFEEVIIEKKKPSGTGDQWDDFKLLRENRAGMMACGTDDNDNSGQTSSVSVLYQCEQIVDGID